MEFLVAARGDVLRAQRIRAGDEAAILRHTASPSIRSGSRLVARIRTSSQACSRPAHNSPAPRYSLSRGCGIRSPGSLAPGGARGYVQRMRFGIIDHNDDTGRAHVRQITERLELI